MHRCHQCLETPISLNTKHTQVCSDYQEGQLSISTDKGLSFMKNGERASFWLTFVCSDIDFGGFVSSDYELSGFLVTLLPP